MAIDNVQNTVAHFLAHHSACHLSDGADRHIIHEGDVQVRFTFFKALVEHVGHHLPDHAGFQALRIIELGNRIVCLNGSGPASVRNLMAEKLPELFIGYSFDISCCITRQLCEVFTDRGVCSFNGNRSGEANVRRRGADQDLIVPAVNLKASCPIVPVTEGFIIQGNGNLFAFTGFQEDFGKTFQLPVRAVNGRILCMHIQLYNFSAVYSAGIFQHKGRLLLCNLQITVGKGRITQAVAKGEEHRNFCRAIIPVTDVKALAVFHIAFFRREVGSR